ncbi:MAG: UvrD-helicase domain-containing protein, partial [bacterium]
MKIEITDDDIRYSEKILLPKNVSFNEQRKIFIKNLETIDLQAVPGSGKTTVLLAKLLILEKHLPFIDGSGILVISHTNAAIDEIKKRIENYCPRLFKYPSFVGTIQSFIDHFLAIPFYTNLYKRKLFRIDDEIYKERSYTPHDAWVWLDNHPYQKEKILYKSPLDENEEFNINLTKNTKTYKALLKMKQELMNKGVLCFADAYILAMKYLKKYSLIKQLLQKRFRYVYVDEMQDMDKHQYDILENIFFDEGNSKSIYQRIGDKNQAIFSEEVSLENFWNSKSRDVLNIDGSCRFSKEIADVVTCFALNKQNIEGKSTHKSIKPHLLIYTDNTVKNVLPKFVEIIKTKQDNSEIPNNIGKNIKAIGWRKKSDGKNKITIKNYFPEFNETIKRNKIDHSSLKEYLFSTRNDVNRNCLGGIENNILSALLKVLTYEEINDSNGRYYTKRRLVNFLKEQHMDSYQEMKLKLFLWCRDIYTGNANRAYVEIREYVTKFLNSVFEKERIISKD